MILRGSPSASVFDDCVIEAGGTPSRKSVDSVGSHNTPRSARSSNARTFYSSGSHSLRDRTNVTPLSHRSGTPVHDQFRVDGDFQWLPGDVLPQNLQVNQFLSCMQKMESKLDFMCSKLDNIESRVLTLEQNPQAGLSPCTSSCSSSSETGYEAKRNRRSPPELQFLIRSIHAAFSDDDKLHQHERIDSEHNRTVVEKIVKEIGTKTYTAKQIRDGCRIHRKTLHSKDSERSDQDKRKMRIRSRQQRLFDRRKKAVLQQPPRVQTLWKDVTPEMMTEEETGSEDNYVRHRPSWRSGRFNVFIDKLDASKNVKTLAKQRKLGDSVVRDVPCSAKKWMISEDSASAESSVESSH